MTATGRNGADGDAFANDAMKRHAEGIAAVAEFPAPTTDQLWDKIGWLKTIADDEKEIGQYTDGRLTKMIDAIARDYQLLPNSKRIGEALRARVDFVVVDRASHAFLSQTNPKNTGCVPKKSVGMQRDKETCGALFFLGRSDT